MKGIRINRFEHHCQWCWNGCKRVAYLFD